MIFIFPAAERAVNLLEVAVAALFWETVRAGHDVHRVHGDPVGTSVTADVAVHSDPVGTKRGPCAR